MTTAGAERTALTGATAEQCTLGGSATVLGLESWQDNRNAAVLLAGQSRRTLDILTHDLEPALYDQQAFLDSVRALALRGRHSRIRILVQDSGRAVREGHRMIELARRLTTYIHIRKPHPDDRDHPEAFVIADGRGVLHRTLATRYEGTICCNAPLQVRDLQRFFDEAWERSAPDAELRRLHL